MVGTRLVGWSVEYGKLEEVTDPPRESFSFYVGRTPRPGHTADQEIGRFTSLTS